jgi:hypothetical protein
MLFFLPFYPSIVADFSILERLANIVKSNEAQLQQLT